MRNLAPKLLRQRLLIEGYYSINVDAQVIRDFFHSICEELNLRFYADPIVFSPAGMGREGNQGYDAFVPLIDSGISAYVWTSEKFLSVVIYTCKGFDEKRAVAKTADFFKTTEVEFFHF